MIRLFLYFWHDNVKMQRVLMKSAYHYTDDDTLFKAIKEGDDTAFEHLFYTYYDPLCKYISSLSPRPAMAKDVVQDVFVKFWNKRTEIIITTSLKSYLYQACYHTYINAYQKDKRKNQQLEELKLHKLMALDEETNEVKNEKKKQLTQAIEKLPPRCREIFELKKIKNLTHEDIARRLDISVKTVENQMTKAYAELKKALL